jgi:hypothetical protein
MRIRKAEFFAAVGIRHNYEYMAGRQGSQLTGGEDIELGILIGREGFRRLFVPQLKLTHLIPKSRLKASYICRLITGTIRSELTVTDRYGLAPYGAAARLRATTRLIIAGLAAPLLIMSRKDGLREALFVLADRWARFKGPYFSGSGVAPS